MIKPARATAAHRIGLACLIILIIVCIAWEWWLAPIRDGGSWLIIKVLPLFFPVWRIWRGDPKTRRHAYQGATLLIWFYFAEGAVRVWSDTVRFSQILAMIEVTLCVLFFTAAIIYVRNTPAKILQI